MYEETRSSIDWKGLFLKVIIAFLIILIAFKAYSTLKGNKKDTNAKVTTETVAKSKTSSTFTANIEKLKKAGEEYFAKNEDKLPTTEGNSVMVTLNDLVKNGVIETLTDEDGKTCDGESSYVTAIKEGEKTKIKANLVCGSASSYSLVYMGENDSELEETKTSTPFTKSTKSNSTSYSNTKSTTTNSNSSSSNNCSSCATPSIKVVTNSSSSSNVTINSGSKSKKTVSTNTPNTTRKVTVSFDSNGGNRTFASQRMNVNEKAYNPGSPYKSGYTFIGWYLNGYEYNFNTPVTRDITLVAKYKSNTYNYNYDYYYDDDYLHTYSNEYNTRETDVYTMGWFDYNASSVTVSHVLKLPTALRNYSQVRIKSIRYAGAIDTISEINTYNARHASTFIYKANGWESYNGSTSTLSRVTGAVFNYDSNFKTIREAKNNGFGVSWTSTGITDRCDAFTVTGPNNGRAENVCNYGIIYKVTWEYR